jgi:hypothetical protein
MTDSKEGSRWDNPLTKHRSVDHLSPLDRKILDAEKDDDGSITVYYEVDGFVYSIVFHEDCVIGVVSPSEKSTIKPWKLSRREFLDRLFFPTP